MKAFIGLAVAVGLLIIWRKPAADAKGEAQGTAMAGGKDAAAEGLQTSEAAKVEVKNSTTNEQNTVTLGNDARAEVGGDLSLGGSGGLATGDGGGSSVSTTQNTVSLGENAVLHVGSGRRPARESDYAEFFSQYRTRGFPVTGGPPSNRRVGDVSLEFILPNAGVFGLRDLEAALPTLEPMTKEALASTWSNYFGNAVAFPGQPIN